MLKLDQISGTLWQMTKFGSTLLVLQNFMLQTTIVRYLCIALMSRDQRKKHLCTSCEREPSVIIGISLETTHYLNPGSVWQDSNGSREIHQNDTCGFKADWRRNKLRQDQERFCRKNGQTCPKEFLRKAINRWAEEKQKLEATRDRRGI